MLKYLGIKSYDVGNFLLHNSARQEIIMNIYTLKEKTNVAKCSKLVNLGDGHMCVPCTILEISGGFEIFQNKKLEI